MKLDGREVEILETQPGDDTMLICKAIFIDNEEELNDFDLDRLQSIYGDELWFDYQVDRADAIHDMMKEGI